MTTVEFQPDTGHLRLGRATFDQLVRWYADRGDPGRAGPIPAALSAAGAADPHGNLAPPVDLAFSAVTGAICQLAIEVRRVDTDTGDGAEESGSGWVTGDAATLLLPLPDGRHELGLVHPTFLPAMLLRVVELGPRPRLATPAPVSAELTQLDQLTGADPAARTAAATTLLGTARPRRDWQIRATWRPSAGSTGVRVVRVLDTDDGLWLVEASQREAVLFPTTPTAVFRALVRLLPQDHELAAPA